MAVSVAGILNFCHGRRAGSGSRSVRSCSLHGALEVVQPLGRRAVGCVFVPFL